MVLGSGFPDPGVKKAPDPGSGSATLMANNPVFISTRKHPIEPVLRGLEIDILSLLVASDRGSGSAWTRIHLAVLDPDPYRDCGSVSRSMEIEKKIN
jgi:hypothetical protein